MSRECINQFPYTARRDSRFVAHNQDVRATDRGRRFYNNPACSIH